MVPMKSVSIIIEFKSRQWLDVLDSTICQWYAAGQRFSLDTSVSFSNCLDIMELLFKVALDTSNSKSLGSRAIKIVDLRPQALQHWQGFGSRYPISTSDTGDNIKRVGGWVMVFNATFNNISVISWRSVLLVEITGVPGAIDWKTLSHNVA